MDTKPIIPSAERASTRSAAKNDEPWRGAPIQAGAAGIWLGCMVVGILGLRLPYPKYHIPNEPPPVMAASIRVDLPMPSVTEVEPVGSGTPSAAPAKQDAEPPSPPPPAEIAPLPAAAPMLAVAEPSPAIAFAVPVEGPAKVVDAKHAQAPPAQAPAPAAPVVQRLTFGVGQGQQPNPEYPREAVLSRQTGAVKVRFVVNTEGKVTSAEVTTPSRWPLLNQAALRAIRDRWHFSAGQVRYFEVSIEFELN